MRGSLLRAVTPPPTFLDKAIAYVDPIRAARRQAARGFLALTGGYTGARLDRLPTREWITRGQSAEVAINPDLQVLRNRSRDLARNAPIAAGAIITVTENVIGRGLALQARPDWNLLGMTAQSAKEWARKTESEFLLFAESLDCDITRVQNFFSLQKLIFRSVLESGDVVVLLPMRSRPSSPYTLALQVIEGDRLANPDAQLDGARRKDGKTISAGVEIDPDGAPVAYWILDQHPGGPNRVTAKASRVAAYSKLDNRRLALHIFDRTRPGQTRGVPYLAPVIEVIKQLDRYVEAEVMASVLQAMFVAFTKTVSGDGIAAGPGVSPDEAAREIKMGAGGIVELATGEEIAGFPPTRPNSAFEPFMLAVLRQIGVALGLPFEVLVKHFTASYSAARAALLEAWKFYRTRREFLSAHFCQPVYEAWIEEAILLGRIDAPGFFVDPAIRRAYLLTEWVGDAMPQIDPVKEVEAAAKRIELGISTRQDETMQNTGKDWSDVNEQIAEEKRLMRENGTEPVAAQPGGPDGGAGERTPQSPPPPPNQTEQGDFEEARV